MGSPALHLAPLTGIAYFLAAGLTTLAGGAGPRAPPRSTSSPAAAPARGPASAAPILSRNIFESRAGAMGAGGRCPLDLALISTVVGAEPASSFAAIGSRGRSRLYRVGSTVGGARVSRIGWRKVVLETAGELTCTIEMFGERDAAVPAPEPANLDGIRKVGETEWVIERRLVERLLASPLALAGTARVRPRERGVQISGIRPGALLDGLGLRNGDVLLSVGDWNLGDPRSVLEALDGLPTAEQLTLKLLRRGVPETFSYEIR